MSQRLMRLAPAVKPSLSSQPRFAARNAAAIRALVLRRNVQTQSFAPEKADAVLNSQRLLRPSSPHFTIYQPQLTWVASIANRFTGAGLSVLLYGFALSYAFLPFAGITFTGAELVELVGSLPEVVKTSAKVILAAPFAFHSWNGLRHLAWDSGKFLTIKGVYQSGYTVLGLSALTTIGLLFV